MVDFLETLLDTEETVDAFLHHMIDSEIETIGGFRAKGFDPATHAGLVFDEAAGGKRHVPSIAQWWAGEACSDSAILAQPSSSG